MYRKISLNDWIAVPDNPIQRDTERHAARADHLRNPLPSHQFVFAAELPSGKLIKLDGHTRALLWKRKEVEAPSHVFVGVIPVKDTKAAEDLYKTFDSKLALETNKDKVYGAFNKQNFEAKSALLQSGNIMTALRAAYAVLTGGTVGHAASGGHKNVGNKAQQVAKTDIYTMINEFTYELHTLDGFNLRVGQAAGGVIAAFILSNRKYGHKVTPFWQGVFSGAGTKQGHQMDAIQATCELIMRRKGGHSGGSGIADMAARCLGGVEKWMEDAVMTRMPSPIDTQDYLKGRERPSERLIKARDKAAA